MLMMCENMHNVVNVYIMYVIVDGLFYGLECEHMSIVDCCWCCIARWISMHIVAFMVVANSHGEELVSKSLWIVVDVCMLGDLACIA